MFKIGEFSRLGKVTVDTLRHYDALGLLKPAQIDRFTGYRYYSANQLFTLNRIAALKELGFSLDEIAQILQEDLSIEQLRGMLKMQAIMTERELTLAQQRLGRVMARLNYLDQEDMMPRYEVTLKSVEPQMIAAMREVVAHVDQMPERCGAMFGAIAQWMGANNIPFGPSMTRYFNDEYTHDNIDTECSFIIAKPTAIQNIIADQPIEIKQLDAVPTMATTIVADDFQHEEDGLTPAFTALAQWIEDHGYTIVGPSREVFYGSPETNDLTAEIQFPVEKE